MKNNDYFLSYKAGLLLVFLNSIRAIPHYIGAFYISESVEFNEDNKINKLIGMCIIIFLILFTYIAIDVIHNIKYDIGLPAILMSSYICFFRFRNYIHISQWKKTLSIISFISSIQILDIIPILDKLPIGRGVTSKEVKLVVDFLNIKMEYSVIMILLFFILILFSFLFFLLISRENKMLENNKLIEFNRTLENQNRLRNLENRTYKEIRHLAHDLKSPITAAQLLIEIVLESLDRENYHKEKEYLEKVDNSLEDLNIMISEVLSEDNKSIINVSKIIDIMLANISSMDYSTKVQVFDRSCGGKIYVNKITFVRSLINLIENASHAIDKDGNIKVIIDRIQDKGLIEIRIVDNGDGIDPEVIDRVWELGYTTDESFGLGLNFVKETINKLDGSISINSTKNVGTEVTITLKEA